LTVGFFLNMFVYVFELLQSFVCFELRHGHMPYR
jgi:hypothetical protein